MKKQERTLANPDWMCQYWELHSQNLKFEIHTHKIEGFQEHRIVFDKNSDIVDKELFFSIKRVIENLTM